MIRLHHWNFILSLQGRFGNERSRLSGEFTDADRAWRKQWLKDQVSVRLSKLAMTNEKHP